MFPLILDGARGEGGGQILRTALTLSAITGRPFVLQNVRAGREKPGLMRQHMMAVRSAAETCDAEVTGLALGSQKISFRPQTAPKRASYTFSIGSAGSTMLVLQTILPILLSAKGDDSITLILEGGTHNPMAPTWLFFETAFLPVLRSFGAIIDAKLHRPGFYPAGGGKVELTLRGFRDPKTPHLVAHDLVRAEGDPKVTSVVEISKIPSDVAKREHREAMRLLHLDRRHIETITYEDALCAGNVFGIRAEFATAAHGAFHEYFLAIGERGVSSETVARDASEQFQRWDEARVFAGEHLADQLLLPLALGGGGSFTTVTPTLHSTTQAETLALFELATARFEKTGADAFVATVKTS